MKKIILILGLLIFSNKVFICQVQNSLPDSTGNKNVIHWNLTPLLLWSGTSIILGYERLLDENRSLVFSFGFQKFPRYKKVGDDDISKVKYSDRNGFRVALEYRFYWTDRNVFPAPDGLYIGPYLSYSYFGLKNSLLVGTEIDVADELNFNARLSRISFGFQLGYQFIIKDKFSIDLMMLGPSVATNFGSLTLSGNISEEYKVQLYEKMLDKITDSFPILINKLSDSEIKSNGDFFNWGAGFRYMIQIGYAF